MRTRVLAAVIGTAGTVGTAWAAPAGVAPANGLGALAFYVGDWDCTWAELGPDGEVVGEEHPVSVEVRPEIASAWLTVKVFDDAGALVSTELKGWDPAARVFRHLYGGADGFGGMAESPGFVGDDMTFTIVDPARKPSRVERMVFTRVSDDRFLHRIEVPDGKTYRAVSRKQCTRR